MEIPIENKKFIKNLIGSIFLFLLGLSALFISTILYIQSIEGIKLGFVSLYFFLLFICGLGLFLIYGHLKIFKKRKMAILVSEIGVLDNTGIFKRNNFHYFKNIRAVEFYKTDKGINYYTLRIEDTEKKKNRNVIISDRLISTNDLEKLITYIKLKLLNNSLING